MQFTSIVAIYGLFWVLSAFIVMPFGLRTTADDENSEKVAGQVESAPINFQPRKILLRATILAAVLFGAFYLNYVMGWISVHDINLFGEPPAIKSH